MLKSHGHTDCFTNENKLIMALKNFAVPQLMCKYSDQETRKSCSTRYLEIVSSEELSAWDVPELLRVGNVCF